MKPNQDTVSASPKSPNSSSPNTAFQRLCQKISPKQSPQRSSTSENRDNEVIERVFNYFDENGDGKISATELQSCMRTTGGEFSMEEAEMAVQSSDSDDDGMLGLEDFTKIVKGSGSEDQRKDDLREAFGMYAAEGRGCITPKSLKRMLSRLGESTSVADCEAMIRKYDHNRDGVLSFDEFRKMMQ